MIKKEVLDEARNQIGLLLRKIRTERGIGTKTLSTMTGMTETQILDIEKNRRNYTIDNFLKYVQAMDLYFFLSEKEANHLNYDNMIDRYDPNDAVL